MANNVNDVIPTLKLYQQNKTEELFDPIGTISINDVIQTLKLYRQNEAEELFEPVLHFASELTNLSADKIMELMTCTYTVILYNHKRHENNPDAYFNMQKPENILIKRSFASKQEAVDFLEDINVTHEMELFSISNGKDSYCGNLTAKAISLHIWADPYF